MPSEWFTFHDVSDFRQYFHTVTHASLQSGGPRRFAIVSFETMSECRAAVDASTRGEQLEWPQVLLATRTALHLYMPRVVLARVYIATVTRRHHRGGGYTLATHPGAKSATEFY